MSAVGSDGDPRLIDFVQRLIADEFPGGQSHVSVFLGRFPPDSPVDLPEFPGSDLLGTAVHRRADGPVAVEVLLDVSQPPRDALSRYEQILLTNGWEMDREHGPGGPPGFLTASVGNWRTYRKGSGDSVLVVNALNRDGGGTDLHLRIQWGMPRNMPARQNPVLDLMPPLIPPPDVTLEPGGGSRGHGHTVDATTESDTSPKELERYFRSQLDGLGWVKLDGEATDKIAWSSWSRPGGDKSRAFLLVTAAFPGELYTSFHVERPHDDEDQGHGFRRWPRRF